MKKHNLIIVITIILASIITYQALTLAEKFDPDERKTSIDVNLPEYLTLEFEVETYNHSSHVFFGEVTRKESRKVGDNSSYNVFTYITVQVERYDKGEGENEVVVRYEGGTLGKSGYAVISTPHGIVSLIVGQEAIFFTNKVEGKENLYYTYYVKKTHSRALASPQPKPEHAENVLDRDYRIQVPEDSEYRTLRGVLDAAPFPLSKREASKPTSQDFIMENVLVIETHDSFDEPSGERLYLFTDGPGNVSPQSSRFYTPDSTGHKLLGGVILTEVYEARVNGLTVEVDGPTFSYQRLGETYNLVKVEEIRILEAWRLPLLVSHDFELASGNYHFGFSGEDNVEFPFEFPVGYIHHEDEFGDAEHNLHVLLNEGERAHIEFNCTGPVHFGLLKPNSHISHGYYDPGSTSFYFADADDFYVRETNTTRTSFEFRAPERGYYNLLFKAYMGKEGTVSLNVTRLEE